VNFACSDGYFDVFASVWSVIFVNYQYSDALSGVSITESVVTPHAHTRTPENYPGFGLEAAANYCRNPDGHPGGIWCYMMEEATRWDE